jgi:hypothetical protein
MHVAVNSKVKHHRPGLCRKPRRSCKTFIQEFFSVKIEKESELKVAFSVQEFNPIYS